MATRHVTLDGNEAVARVAHAVNDVIAIYPITPASPMGEHADAWSAAKRTNLWGEVPRVIEMQSEGGAAGAVHGSLQAGALTTTFTASQGLLLMIPNLFKIAGELTPAVIHVAARSVATHALSIFGDHSDVMAARSTGFAMLCSGSVQEAHDFALVAQSATLEARVPFLHFFDGFRTSHEVNKIAVLDDDDLSALIDDALVAAHRARALTPNAPVLRGTAQNPDVFFQAREAANPFYEATPEIVRRAFDRFAERTGRRYGLFDYAGDPDAEHVVVMMGSGTGAAEAAIAHATARGEKVGLVTVRLYRPFDRTAFLAALPSTTRRISVLDRTKEPGAPGEPLYLDVAATVAALDDPPTVAGGRYGLSSKELTPAMVEAVLASRPKHDFTIGIRDDVTHKSVEWDATPAAEPDDVYAAVFFGLGSDGTVGASKNTVKIIGEHTDQHAQGYFVYDSKKSGAITVSHLRFAPRPIHATYLVEQARFVGCHQFGFLEKMDVLSRAADGATLLLNSPYPGSEVWDHIPVEAQQQIIDKKLAVYTIDASRIALEAGLRGRINTVMQTCFFALAKVLPGDAGLRAVRDATEKTYATRGPVVVAKNLAAIDAAVDALERVEVPAKAEGHRHRRATVPHRVPDFVARVTAMILEGRGDQLPVSAMPVDGTFPTGTAQYEKRSIAETIPIWDPDVCTQCGLCPLVCPHAAIRLKSFDPDVAREAPDGFRTHDYKGKDRAGEVMTIQVAPDDCTGCGVCVDVCPAKSKEIVKHKAINMADKREHLEQERDNYEFFLDIPEAPRPSLDLLSVKGSQIAQPLFEYSGACAGCGETPYLKLLTQMFGDRLIVANATGCSSIFGGNLPTTPWTRNAEGRGPAWSNSLFEDNAEFGLGMRLAVDAQTRLAEGLLWRLRDRLDADLVDTVLSSRSAGEAEIIAQRERIAKLKAALSKLDDERARRLESVADHLEPRSVWIVGGDGWAYDIGFGGVDHALASGLDINVLVLDTEVYSNTGGQASKATPRAAVAKFAAAGKEIGKKDLGMIAMAYGNVYVAQIALGASPKQTLKAFAEAAAYPGPSLIIAYSTCIAHGIDMAQSMTHQRDATKSGYWPLYRFDPRRADDGHPFALDSKRPSLPFKVFAEKEARFAMLARTDPERATHLAQLAQRDIDERWSYYEQLAGVERHPVANEENKA
ncbi:MAG: pyruvate:ferredoxin (flavodoxin) oxidoreductase [Deltaproteobacteria bacterium]